MMRRIETFSLLVVSLPVHKYRGRADMTIDILRRCHEIFVNRLDLCSRATPLDFLARARDAHIVPFTQSAFPTRRNTTLGR